MSIDCFLFVNRELPRQLTIGCDVNSDAVTVLSINPFMSLYEIPIMIGWIFFSFIVYHATPSYCWQL